MATTRRKSAGSAPLDPLAEQVMVPMRDGMRLATDVYLPDAGVPVRHPAVLVRLPYDKAGRYTFMPMLAPYITDRGYAFVVQDVRGKFRSEGETVPFVHEVDDGYDTLEWLVGQAWSDGTVVMFGDSYYGFTQWAAVASGHPALRAIVPRVTSADLATVNWSGEGVTALYGADYLAHYWVDNPIYDYAVDWSQRPLATVFDEAFGAIGARSRGLDILLEHEAEGMALPNPFPNGHPFERLTIPVLHTRRLVRQPGPRLDAGLPCSDRSQRPRRSAVPDRRLKRPRELPARRRALRRSRHARRRTTTRSSA